MTAFDAVIFDFFGTLTPATTEATWLDFAARTAAPLGIPAEQWFEVLSSSMTERFIGVLGDLEETITVLANRCGVRPSPQAVAASCAIRRETQRTLFATRPETLSVLAELRAGGLRIGVVSDCTIELAEAWPELAVAEAVDVAVLSCTVGAAKPDAALFRLATDQLGVAPTRCLYAGDGGGDELVGASAQGMTAVHIDIAEPGAGVHGRGWNGLRVTSLAAVAALAIGERA